MSELTVVPPPTDEPPPISDEEFDAELAEPHGKHHLKPAAHYIAQLRDFQNEGRKRAISWGVQFLTDHLGYLYGKDLVVAIGDTGSGKTTFARIVTNEALAGGKRVAFFALEAHDGEVQQRQIYSEVRRLAWERRVEGCGHLTFGLWANGLAHPDVHRLDAKAVHLVYAQSENLVMRYRGDRFTADNISREFRAIGDEVDLVVLDHLHYVDDSSAQSENASLSEITKTLRNVALDIGRPVVAVAHVRKRGAGKAASAIIPTTEDIHGTSNVGKITTRVISLAPAYDRLGSGKKGIATTYMQVVKDRWDGAKRIAALLRFNLSTGAYESDYQLGRFNFEGSKFEAFTRDEVPDWCSCPDEHPLPKKEG